MKLCKQRKANTALRKENKALCQHAKANKRLRPRVRAHKSSLASLEQHVKSCHNLNGLVSQQTKATDRICNDEMEEPHQEGLADSDARFMRRCNDGIAG